VFDTEFARWEFIRVPAVMQINPSASEGKTRNTMAMANEQDLAKTVKKHQRMIINLVARDARSMRGAGDGTLHNVPPSSDD